MIVTGGAGFIGSNFVEMMVEKGHNVYVVDKLTYAGHKENLESIKGPGSFELIEGDICNADLMASLLKSKNIQSVVHFAAESHVDRSIDGPAEFIQTNIQGTFTLLDQSYQYWKGLDPQTQKDFRYLQVSTDEVYGELGEEGYFSETTPYSPNSPYSASKAAGDHLVRAWFHTYQLPTITTNCSNNYGPKQFPEKLIPHMINCALSEKPLPVYGDGKNVRDWIHVKDHCYGVYLALTEGVPGETYCFGGRAERQNLTVVHTLCDALDKIRPRSSGESYRQLITFVEDRKGHDWRYAIDDSKAENQLGFKRQWSFETGISETIQWYLNNEKWAQAVLEKA
ncbi:MAG: dTDP-glucose 4,6-dehydratase [Bdellovibrionales bacterium]|nr:dTDP-glucose 4,6-dehydratase [Bdellovibrionales bacterium]